MVLDAVARYNQTVGTYWSQKALATRSAPGCQGLSRWMAMMTSFRRSRLCALVRLPGFQFGRVQRSRRSHWQLNWDLLWARTNSWPRMQETIETAGRTWPQKRHQLKNWKVRNTKSPEEYLTTRSTGIPNWNVISLTLCDPMNRLHRQRKIEKGQK